MNKIINELIELKEDYNKIIEEIIYENLNNDEEYKDLTKAEINQINELRKNVFYIYEAISILDKVKESE